MSFKEVPPKEWLNALLHLLSWSVFLGIVPGVIVYLILQ